MTQCKSMTQNDKPCSRSALKSDFCEQHDKDAKIIMYRKELTKMHQRVRRYLEISNDLHSKMMDIQRLDYYKSELIKLAGNGVPFRAILSNSYFKDQIEALFEMSMAEARDEYDRLLKRRNQLVHPHTIDGWAGMRYCRISC
ncbi:hypothetical protein PHYSODRAFT_535294 [Phytophthora sojae]|uniref:Uncharacterized protein n=1 Tax=Phytophthora sojae (strain P6497) TaxID=1094619 RepID=G5AHU7_PHYSP|nr:hypothetical protein PHYSODRAFT_535294 [Phytophthora sojae]EGZ04908.1 hypothetical protein PHYSODRAFT_535294 [Phytophthora sojae]|eukprot:XP_009539648.1 hypothetical protein PHYSODRAFT_535294 [Phytophthora sojae]